MMKPAEIKLLTTMALGAFATLVSCIIYILS
jgi:hypothetical protein